MDAEGTRREMWSVGVGNGVRESLVLTSGNWEIGGMWTRARSLAWIWPWNQSKVHGVEATRIPGLVGRNDLGS